MRLIHNRMGLSAGVAFVGLVWFSGGVVALHLLSPNFDPTRRFLSEYVRSSHGSLMEVNFFVLALSAGALAAAIGGLKDVWKRSQVGMYLLASASVCLALLGIFPSDLQESSRTLIGVIHDRLSLLPFAFVFVVALLLIKDLLPDGRWTAMRYGSYMLAGLGAIGVVAGGFAQGDLHWSGLLQRIVACPLLAWLMLLSLRLIRFASAEHSLPS